MRLKQDVGDLSRQVTTLLYEVEKLRAKLLNAHSVCTNEKSIKKKEADETIDSSFTMLYEPNEAEVSSSSDIITKHMIDFRYLYFCLGFVLFFIYFSRIRLGLE
jgi:hypothetical protein